ncbi:MAG: hypothetical protein QXP01_04720 [Candidatus Hadarchaeum sp.]
MIALSVMTRSIRAGCSLVLISALCLAFSDIIRPISIVLVLPVLVFLIIRNKDLGIGIGLPTAIGFGLVTVLTSQALIHAASALTSEAIPMPSQRWGYNFLIGTNSGSWGRYNDEDVKLIASVSGNEFERNLTALKIGF